MDSQAALLALNSMTITSKKVAETIHELNLLAHSKSVQLVWTKPHVGTPGNEFADQEAKAGANENSPAPTLPPRGYIKGLIKDNILNEWDEERKRPKRPSSSSLIPMLHFPRNFEHYPG